ncbi:MAG: hypothetical protein K2Q25_10725 [Mycobacteriaceae bacterium]|nr:hypothetical protein [Mycobacteriaceae bacterium]
MFGVVGRAGVFAGIGGWGRECVGTAELVDAAGGREHLAAALAGIERI